MAKTPALNAALHPDVIQPRPDTSADVEARGLLRRAAQGKPASARTVNNGASVGGTKVSGGARISGGKG